MSAVSMKNFIRGGLRLPFGRLARTLRAPSDTVNHDPSLGTFMAEQLLVGCADLPHGIGWERYFARLSFVETSVLTRNPARPSVLARWRAAAPGPGCFALVAPEITTDPVGILRGLPAYLEAARALEAGVLLVRTSPAFTPSATHRDVLRRLFGEVLTAEAAGGAVRVWLPEGLWDTRTAVTLAREVGVGFGCDPSLRDQTREPPDFYATLEIPDVYFRVTGLGRGTRTLPSSTLDELAETVAAYPRAWVVFATVDAMADATRFQRLTGAPATD
jgi:uncharacterized protein YecE (DUF72 family)